MAKQRPVEPPVAEGLQQAPPGGPVPLVRSTGSSLVRLTKNLLDLVGYFVLGIALSYGTLRFSRWLSAALP